MHWLLCISTSFWVLRAIHAWNQQKRSENEQKKWNLSTPQSWLTCKSWSTPWGGTSNLSFFSWFFSNILKGLLIFSCFGVMYSMCAFSSVSTWFQVWNHWKRFKKKEKGWELLKNNFNQLLGARSIQKLVEIHNNWSLNSLLLDSAGRGWTSTDIKYFAHYSVHWCLEVSAQHLNLTQP